MCNKMVSLSYDFAYVPSTHNHSHAICPSLNNRPTRSYTSFAWHEYARHANAAPASPCSSDLPLRNLPIYRYSPAPDGHTLHNRRLRLQEQVPLRPDAAIQAHCLRCLKRCLLQAALGLHSPIDWVRRVLICVDALLVLSSRHLRGRFRGNDGTDVCTLLALGTRRPNARKEAIRASPW